MALTEKQKEQIREEEGLRLEVRQELCRSKARCGHGRKRGFWLGLALGILGSFIFGHAVCGRGYIGKHCSYQQSGAPVVPQAEVAK